MSLYKKSAFALRSLFLKGEVSAKEIASYFLQRITSFDSDIKAFLEVFSERTIKKAEELDKKRARKEPLGKLAGVPIAIKDNMHIQGELTTCASQFLKNYRAPFSATAVSLMEQEDALLLGKTNLDEFAMGSSMENSSFFPSKNPWDLQLSPGGSSGGSSAAVGGRLVPLATGSDTGGSIRQPASFCGVYGFKPTYGRVSRYGLVAFGSSLDQIGPIGTSSLDCALMMETIGAPCKRDSTCLNISAESYLDKHESLKGKKIGVPWDFLTFLEKDALASFTESTEKLEALGAEIHKVDLQILQYSIAVYYILGAAEASTNLARFDGIRFGVRSKKAKSLEEVYDLSRDEGFGLEVKRRILLGTHVLSSGFKNAYYQKAQKVRTLMIQAFEKAFQTCDLIAIPTTPKGAFPLHTIQDPLAMYLQDIFTICANLAGLPALSMPSGFDSEGKPLGIQFLGPQLHDQKVILSGYAFEKAYPEHIKIPPLFNKEAS